MDILKIKTIYQRLCEDAKSLERLEILFDSDKEREIIRQLQRSNQNYRQELIASIQKQFPEMTTDVRCWTDEELSCWFNLLIEYPVFWLGKEGTLIAFLWLLDIKGSLQNLRYSEQIGLLCTHRNMVDYAADPCNEGVVRTLWVLIDKYASLVEAEQFQNRVNLRINEIS
jgi:hypothetical protein